MARPTLRNWVTWGATAAALTVMIAAIIWRDDIFAALLDPGQPYQVYRPPAAPDYGSRESWALMPADPKGLVTTDPVADIFFIMPTVYDGGRHWNAPIDDLRADKVFRQIMAPNYAGPFVRDGRLFAPRYRQASLYSLSTLREDARDARRFAYGDVAAAFGYYLATYNHGRPFVLIGVEQGGTLAARLLAEEIVRKPEVRAKLAAAYLIEAVTPADNPPLLPCLGPDDFGCLAAWTTAVNGDLRAAQDIRDRSLVWGTGGELENLKGRLPLCFNPLLRRTTNEAAAAKLGQGAANATGLEWGTRPAFLTRQTSAQCIGGVLQVSAPKASMLKRSGSWADRQRVPGYNLFYADLEADAKHRIDQLIANPRPAAATRPASQTGPAKP